MNKPLIALAATAALLLSASVGVAEEYRVFSVSKNDHLLRTINPTTGVVETLVPLTLAGETIVGVTGLTWRLSSGEVFGLVKLLGQSGRQLVKIDPVTGVCTNIGNTGRKFATMAFNYDNNRLYGVTGDGAAPPETLYLISTNSASSIELMPLGNGNDGEAIAFNPDDGLIYHLSGEGVQNVDEIFETIDLSTLEITGITLSGSQYTEITALSYQGDGVFLMTDLFLNLLHITTSGEVTFVAPIDHSSKGLIHVPVQPVALSIAKVGAILKQIDPTSGATLDSVALTLPGKTIVGGHGLTWDPILDRLYALVEVTGQAGRELVTIDLPTGVCSSIGDTGDLFEGLVFDASGTLFGVTGESASTPETLFELSWVDATSTSVLSLGGGGAGEALGASMDDGLLYRASGFGVPDVDETLESIDPDTFIVTPIGLSGADYQQASAMGYDGESFLLSDEAQSLFRVGPAGAVTGIGALDHVSKGIAVVKSPDCALLDPGSSIAAPIEVLKLGLLSSDPAVADWLTQDSELVYDAVGGLLSELHADGGTDSADCLDAGMTGTRFSDARPDPPVGDGYYYLIRARNACMGGTHGYASSGQERVPAGTCP